MRNLSYNAQDIYLSYIRTETPDQKSFYLHTHIYTELLCFVAGKAEYHVEGTVYSLEPGDILLVRPGEAHYVQVDETVPYERLFINFDTSIFSSLDPENELTRAIFQRRAGTRNHYRMGEAGIDATKRIIAKNTRMHILGNLILLLQTIGERFSAGQESTETPETLEYRMIRYINKNLGQKLTLQELCERFFISRTQLYRLFKQATGISVGSYIIGKRMLAARDLLLQGTKPTEVFVACGYSDYSTFFRAYTRFFGHTPRQEQAGCYTFTPDVKIFIGQSADKLPDE